MNIKPTFGLVTVAIMLTACQSNSFKIKGEAIGFDDGEIVCLTNDLNSKLPTDSLHIKDGAFEFYGTADSTYFCMAYLASNPDNNITFFVEPGKIVIELSSEIGKSRVSGTKINNEWQALNDMVGQYDQKIRNVIRNTTDSMTPKKQYVEMDRIYNEITYKIIETGKRNKDNAMGQFILQR